jgi:hypothetical protein
MGINSHGEVVYGKVVDGYVHAYRYLPASHYGFTGPAFIDLHVQSDVQQADSIARDINDNSENVGQLNDCLLELLNQGQADES